MAVTCDQFGKALVASGLMTGEEVKALWAGLPAAERPKDGTAFAALLAKRGLLTEFQSKELLSGSTTPLALGDYVLLARIGAGGMGQVFKAQHRHMKRLVAIKLLPAATTKDEVAVKRFQREVEAAAKLSHPNIVQAHDASVQRGIWYLVMEHVEGQDLSALSKQSGPLPINEAVNYIRQAACGLAYAHAEGVVHRDIKPANLLLDKKGVVKILDMGLARFDNSADAADHQLTNTGAVMGTVDYMAPEQAVDTHAADARSDIYSLGCSLYRLLTGMNVFEGDTVVKKIMAHMNAPIPSLAVKRPDVPAELDRIFQKMMAKKPEDRYQQASELVADFDAWRSPGGSRGDPSTTPEDSQLTDFLTGLHSPKSSAAAKGSAAALKPGTKTNVQAEQTMAYAGPEAGTDPKSELSIKAESGKQKAAVSAASPVSRNAQRSASARGKKSPVMWIAAGVGTVTVLGVLGVWLSRTDDIVQDSPTLNNPKSTASAAPNGTSLAATITARTTPTTVARDELLERRVAQWLLDHKFPVGVLVKGKSIEVAVGVTLPTEPFTIENITRNTQASAIPRAELLAILADFKKLAAFQGGYLPIHDSDLWAEAYASLPSITIVNAYRCDLTDQGVAHLTRLPKLRELYFDKVTGVTSAGLLALAKCPSLTSLFVDKASFDAGKFPLADLQRLQDALPRCAIQLTGPGIGSEIPGLKRPGTAAPAQPASASPAANPSAAPSSDTWPFDPQDGKEYVWSEPQNLGPGVNTPDEDRLAGISPDERTIYFMTRRLTPVVSRRASVQEAFPASQPLVELKEFGELGAVSANELSWACYKNMGQRDQAIWLSHRKSKDDPFEPPWRAPSPVNDGDARHPVLSNDGLTMLVSSNRQNSKSADIWMFTRPALDQPFNTVERVAEPVSTLDWDMPAYISNDRNFLIAARQTGQLSTAFREFRYFTRASVNEPFQAGRPLGIPLGPAEGNSYNGGFCLSGDGRAIYFHTPQLPGGRGVHDLWVTRRVPKNGVVAPSPAGVVYLDDLPETSYTGYFALGKHGVALRDEPIDWNGIRPPHSLFMHCSSEGHSAAVEYHLAAHYERFQSLVGLFSKPSKPLTLRVVGDGKRLWESPALDEPWTTTTKDVDLDVKGVQTLRLEVEGGWSYCAALWREPRLTLAAHLKSQIPARKSATAPRWPLAPSKPEDIAWLREELRADLTLRTGADKQVVVFHDRPLPSGPATIVGVKLHREAGPQVTDAVLARLATLTDLELLNGDFAPPGAAVTKVGMAEIAKLTELRDLYFGRFGPADADYSFLERLPRLEKLGLSVMPIPNWIDLVRRLRPLREVLVYQMDDARLLDLQHCTQLTDVRLAGTTANVALRRRQAVELAKAAPWLRIHLFTGGVGVTETIAPTAPPPGVKTTGNAPPSAVAPFDAAQAKAHQAAWAKHLGIEVETPNSLGQKMVLIPPGEFMMGSTDEQVEAALKQAIELKADQPTKDRIQNAERPQHKVVITKPFLMGATEVTIGQFKEFSAGASYRTEAERAVEPKTYLNPGYVVSDYLPATFITWNDATAYCQWLSTKENASYRLPDEAEWEYACRAGATTQYSFGDDMSLLAQYAWHHGNPSRTPHPVGTRLPNHFGLFDMHGSVREWCGDVYDEKRYEKTRYETTSSSDPIGPAGGSQRVNRGGYWNSIASTCRSAFRYSYPPSTRYDNQGFRIVRVLDAPASVHSQ